MNKTRIKKNINGILLLDKSIGLTSNAALQKVKHLFCAKKAGHTGSLDPLATGMLPICFGEATKFSQYLLESDKEYRVLIKLGEKTTTGDSEGEVIETKPYDHITHENVTTALQQFTGEIQQIPPMYSALKHQGKPLYELARKGIEVERAPRTIKIYSIAPNWDASSTGNLSLTVHCSKGTYIRTLVEDVAECLGTCGHVIALKRTFVHPYEQYSMVTFDYLEQLLKESGPAALTQLLLPIESSVHALPIVKLSTSAAFYIRMGQPVMVPHLPTSGLVRIHSAEGFLGVGEILDDGRVAPRRLIATSNAKLEKTGIQTVK